MNTDSIGQIISGATFQAPLERHAFWLLTGPDATRYLNGQVTCDVTKIAPGQTARAAICNAKGRMEGLISITGHAGGWWIEANPEQHEALGQRLEKYLIADDAVLEDVSPAWRLTHVFGPNQPIVPEGGFVTSFTRFGLPGWDRWSLAASDRKVSAGERVGEGELEALRIERGVPRWGAELNEQTLPPEAGPLLQEAISYSKGCYVGQEIIARLKSVGQVARRLVYLVAEGRLELPIGTPLQFEERSAGQITSRLFVARRGQTIALAYVPRAWAEIGTVLRVGEQQALVVQPWPEVSK